ncbi:glycoside hydrolase family 15 protein [Lactarius hengduanensis]|nr:glycoside hydrolase family 15 protein [Lactarius hengduanensis]
MRLLPLLTALGLTGLVHDSDRPSSLPNSVVKLDAYIAEETHTAKSCLLANIGPDGAKSHGALAGLVIASPSTQNPDYLFSWTRDSALVFKLLIEDFVAGDDLSLRGLIDAYITVVSLLQQTSNPSGAAGKDGLGEPKFNIDGSPFLRPWGRPQRDGPALRATALIQYAGWLWKNGNSTYVEKSLWPVIRLDLDYVAANWRQPTFDLWEEINSTSFFTAAVQHRSLREGSALASTLERHAESHTYDTQADSVLCFMQSFWNPRDTHIIANTGGGRSGLDSNTVLASIHTFDPAAGCDPITFQPCSDRALANLMNYVDSFRGAVYPINKLAHKSDPIATGRYPEDVYFGGNPWYIATLAVAEQLYDALLTWDALGAITVTPTSKAFFEQFSPDIAPGTYRSDSSSTYSQLSDAIRAHADGFVEIVARHTPPDGRLAEQFDKTSGKPASAADLTWSYAAALTAFRSRKGGFGGSWGAKGLEAVC